MNNRKNLRAAIFIPVLLAVLACPAWAGTSGGKKSHYPGQDCSGCHKGSVMSTGKRTLKSTPAKSSTGTGSAGSQGSATQVKEAPKAR